MWKSAFSSEISIIVTVDIVMSMDSIIIHASPTGLGCMSWCYLITSSADVERTVSFKMGRVTTFKTMILMSSVITSIGHAMRVI
jgi:hypothetical protein